MHINLQIQTRLCGQWVRWWSWIHDKVYLGSVRERGLGSPAGQPCLESGAHPTSRHLGQAQVSGLSRWPTKEKLGNSLNVANHLFIKTILDALVGLSALQWKLPSEEQDTYAQPPEFDTLHFQILETDQNPGFYTGSISNSFLLF